ncbi:hypothetical protein LINPERHAP2_LOCUS3307, partial [Linum perenne]
HFWAGRFVIVLRFGFGFRVSVVLSVLLIGGLLRFELLFKSCFCLRCVLLFSFKAGSSSS